MASIILANITLTLSIIVCFVYYEKLRPRWLKFFAWFLLYLLIAQFAGHFYSTYTKKSNHFFVNSITLVEFLFYFFIFFKTFEKKYLKWLTLIMAFLFVGSFLYHDFFGAGFFIFDSLSNSVGSVFIIVCCFLYFYSLFRSELNLNYFRIPMFWISTGLLFFFTGSSIYESVLNYIVRNNLDPHGNFFMSIMITLNLLLYGLFTCGFLSNQIWKLRT